AGAGSGKTRVLTRRMAWRAGTGSANAGHLLALTFTRKAAGELTDRLRRLGLRDQVAAGTFHSIAYTQLRRRWADLGLRPPGLLERKAGLLAGLMPRRAGAELQPADLASEIEWAKARLVGPADYEAAASLAGRRPPLPAGAMAELYRRYEEEKRRRGMVDFDDLLQECATAIEVDAAFAAAQRWRFRHLFVDEFQDVNPSQFRLLTAWLGDRLDLCVVGDPNQAIYSWNGADPTLLTDFTRRFPSAEVVDLDRNYRSTPQVLAVAGSVLAGARARRGMRPTRDGGPVPAVRSYPTDADEAKGIARLVRDARRPGAPWSDIAVLTRTNAQLSVIERALRQAQVPCRVAGGGAFLAQPEVRSALRRFRSAPVGQPFLSSVGELEASIGLWEEASGEDHDDAPAAERRLQLATVVRLAREYAAADQAPTAAGFDAWLATTIGTEGEDGSGDAVEIATFHRSKGLEWPTVFLAGLERGLVPIGRATTPAAEAEERRLLYVAITRAQHHLHLSWAERRSFGGTAMPRSPSPYLDAVEETCRQLASGVAPLEVGAAVARLREQRRRLAGTSARSSRTNGPAATDGADPEVLAALHRWRATMAKASGVPAYVIFHDSTLAAVARACPTTPEELAGLPGLGPVKTSRYGEVLLALVAEHRASA
ncbi:MAG TPA: ATP-dependent DNA helicase UvrD2, partial [Acidimicrobiales bacterium]|nr:ATP-dependent DNA helicase UvrD2 [Acidimicrobiales bacterium]